MDISIAKAIQEASETLRLAAVDGPRLEAALLLGHTLGSDRAFLIAHDDQALTPEQWRTFSAFVSRRAAGEPLQYITGHQEFFKLDFEVTPDVLIPRPETELIVEAVLELFPHDVEFRFADVGTGSGCIAISILHERQQAQVDAIDQSELALRVAERNAKRHTVADRFHLVHGNLFQGLAQDQLFELVLSNPPYVPDGELDGLQREVRREPLAALAGGTDGLDVIRRLLGEAPKHLHPRGYLIFEFGINQEAALREAVEESIWELIEIRADLQQIPRTIVLRKR